MDFQFLPNSIFEGQNVNSEQFDAFLQGTFAKIDDVLSGKRNEYAPGDDTSRFHNFEVAAAFNDITPEQALWGMLTKHLVSLSDMVKNDVTDYSLAQWDEKIGDAVNYLILLWGLVASQSTRHSNIQFNDTFERPDHAILVGMHDIETKDI